MSVTKFSFVVLLCSLLGVSQSAVVGPAVDYGFTDMKGAMLGSANSAATSACTRYSARAQGSRYLHEMGVYVRDNMETQYPIYSWHVVVEADTGAYFYTFSGTPVTGTKYAATCDNGRKVFLMAWNE